MGEGPELGAAEVRVKQLERKEEKVEVEGEPLKGGVECVKAMRNDRQIRTFNTSAPTSLDLDHESP